MSGTGPIIRLRLSPPPEGCRDDAQRLRACLQRLQTLSRGSAPRSVDSTGPDDTLIQFGLHSTAAVAYDAVAEAVLQTGLAAQVSLWTGPRGTTSFGDSPELSQHLLGLIASGAKSACCGALADYILDGEPLPKSGDLVTVLDHRGRPALYYRVTEVNIYPFSAIPESFMLAEGEGDPETDGLVDAWRDEHAAYFARTCGFDPDMPIVCERFVLVKVALPNGTQSRRGRAAKGTPS